MSWVSVLDWRHVGDLRERQWNYPASPSQLNANPGIVDITLTNFFQCPNPEHIVIDTEFVPNTSILTILGIGLFETRSDLCVPRGEQRTTASILGERQDKQQEVLRLQHANFKVLSITWSEAAPIVRDYIRHQLHKLVGATTTVFQNAVADIPQLEVSLGIKYEDYKQIDDTMLAHAILWCELPHTLDFLGSIYSPWPKRKHLQYVNEIEYNYGDVIDTHAAWLALSQGLKGDAAAERVYREQSLKLIPILLDARKIGIRVNKEKVLSVFKEYQALIQELGTYASFAVGYPINLNSGPQLKRYCYTERRFPIQINRKSKQPSTDDDAIAKLRSLVGPVYDTQKSLTLDQDDERQYSIYRRVEQGADPILEARALWAGAWQVVNNYIVGLGKEVYGEYKTSKRKKGRTKYWKQGLSTDDIVDRIYPNFAIHAQKTGRWSTTNPPLAQLPVHLRDIVSSDANEVCLSWDWSTIEPRVLQALTGSILLKKTFDEGFDLHTWTVCYMFGYEMPPDLVNPHKAESCQAWRIKYNWQGKDDPRRVFAKQGRYEMWYGGAGSNAAASAAQFGLKPGELKMALAKLAVSDPAYSAWRARAETDIRKTSIVRTFMGRPRRFLSTGDAKRREALDQPMQGAVSDIFNTTVVALHEMGLRRWGWGMHDSQKWFVKRELFTLELFEKVKRIVERSHNIAGQETVFPGDFEIILPPEQGGLKVTPAEYFALAS
jgi:DNA polymerase I-like protein with 3'-5' exonuclease and polymerase domains